MAEVADWIVFEVGRLYLDNLALRRELAERDTQVTVPETHDDDLPGFEIDTTLGHPI